ncbi:MAG: HD-GYP domain-containing protein [Desulfitobacteriaceae bacterium]|nr:HD-GYP domain-containing protein [Desulfitobacteriaceae bacterium]
MKSMPKQFKPFFILITALALPILVFAVMRTDWNTTQIVHLLVFGSLVILSESLPVSLPKGGYVSVSYSFFLAALISFPAGVVLSVVAAGGLFVFGKEAGEQPVYKRVFNASQFVLSLATAKLVLILGEQTAFRLTLLSTIFYVVAALAYVMVNVTIVAVALGILQGKSPWKIWMGNMRWSVPNFLALIPLGILMALIYKNFGPFWLVLLLIPLLLSRHSFQLYVDMRQNYLETIKALVQALEAKDSYTSGHSERVADLAVAMAEELGMVEDKQEFVKYAGILHDVGKIGVDEGILNKKVPLLDSEWAAIREHPVIGENIIKKINFLFDISTVVRHHHERYDGLGYPDGLIGGEIPLEARIIAIADTYDAMTSDRSYRKGKTPREAVQELRRVAGTQLDPELVNVFLKILEGQPSQIESAVAAKMA